MTNLAAHEKITGLILTNATTLTFKLLYLFKLATQKKSARFFCTMGFFRFAYVNQTCPLVSGPKKYYQSYLVILNFAAFFSHLITIKMARKFEIQNSEFEFCRPFLTSVKPMKSGCKKAPKFKLTFFKSLG